MNKKIIVLFLLCFLFLAESAFAVTTATFVYYNTQPGTATNSGYSRLIAGTNGILPGQSVQYIWNFNSGCGINTHSFWNDPEYDFYWCYDTVYDAAYGGQVFEGDIPITLTIKDSFGAVLATNTKTVPVLKVCCGCGEDPQPQCGNGILEEGEECEPANSTLSTCDYGASYLQDFCDSSCKLIDRKCEDDYAGCTSDPECDELEPGLGNCSSTCRYSECSNNSDCDDGLWCNGQEYCSNNRCNNGTTVDCSYLNTLCYEGQCNESLNSCVQIEKPAGAPCNDGLWCTTGDYCNAGNCTGNPRDCSGFDISSVSTCNHWSDTYIYTWDYRLQFLSSCDELRDRCTTGNETITHDCSIANCNAECETSADCTPKCVNNIYYFNGTCDSGCECNYGSEDCDSFDSWLDTGNTRWISTEQCTEKEQKEQEHKDYYCGAQGCDYTITGTQWIDTGNTRNKPDLTPCNDGLYCTTGDVCIAGTCSGQPRDCSALENQCNNAVCNEDIDSCIAEPLPENTVCEADSSLCTTEHCNAFGECVLNSEVDCTSLDGACQTGICEPSDGLCYPDYSNFPLSTPCEADGDLCTIDHCNGIGTCIQFDFVDCSLMDDQCNIGQCEPLTGICFPAPVPNETPCDDGLWCNTEEVCIDGTCTNGTPRNCSQFDIPGIAECFWIPDGKNYTWDYRMEFISQCNENTDSCTTGDTSIDHNCSITNCDAECEEDTDCVCQPDGCIGPDYYDYPAFADCLGDCTCGTCEPEISFNDPRCGECFEDLDCDDGFWCNGNETCNLQNYTCENGTPVNCDDAVACTHDSCNETTDTCNNAPDDTICDNGLWCDGIETCQPPEGCVPGTPIDCTLFDLPEVGQCDYTPDGIDYTWDYFVGFTSVCDEAFDECTQGLEDILSECSEACGAECTVDANCECGTDQCVGFDFYDYPELGECLGDCTCGSCEPEIFYQDERCTPPETKKTVGLPKIECDYFGDLNEASECWFVSTDTNISFEEVSGNNCPENEVLYRSRWKADYEDDWDDWSEWIVYTEPFNFEEYSIHELEYYATGCDVNEEHKFEIDIVDSYAPVPIKEVGEPSEVCPGDMDCEFKITMNTPINLSCSDQEPHPVGEQELCYRYFLDGSLTQDWTCVDGNIEIIFDEECFHQLDFYCVDRLGNESEIDSEIFKVQGTAFRIPLYKKWNLVSIPFEPLDNNIELVFEGIQESVESVWAYENGQWLVFRPGEPESSNLTELMPGYGYWIMMFEDNELVIGGSLFNPAEIPPSRPLESGWNLIGYYGLYGEEYSIMEDWDEICGFSYPEKPANGDKAYCSLGSLIEGPGNPKVSSLVSYVNCGNTFTEWAEIDLCIDDPADFTRMYAGRGYWAFINTATEYAPSTVCIWDEDLICPAEGPV